MGKNPPLFRLPLRPTGQIRLLSSYDNYFREHLLDAIRDDFERSADGLPTYHSNMLRIVKDYAGASVDPEDLSLKDLFNFLKGMRSHVPRIQILDAYLQVVNPNARSRCFPDVLLDNVGTTVADYLRSPTLTPYDRERKVRSLIGAYELRHNPRRHRNFIPRYLYVSKSPTSKYVLLYEFNAPQPGASEPDQLKLRNGFAVPQPTTFLFLMRDYLYIRRYIGSLRPNNERRSELTISTLVAREEMDIVERGDGDQGEKWSDLGYDVIQPDFFDPIYDDKTITYIESVVKSLEGVA